MYFNNGLTCNYCTCCVTETVQNWPAATRPHASANEQKKLQWRPTVLLSVFEWQRLAGYSHQIIGIRIHTFDSLMRCVIQDNGSQEICCQAVDKNIPGLHYMYTCDVIYCRHWRIRIRKLYYETKFDTSVEDLLKAAVGKWWVGTKT